MKNDYHDVIIHYLMAIVGGFLVVMLFLRG